MISGTVLHFDDAFIALTGFSPLKWQERLFAEFDAARLPDAIDLPTGLGKTSVMAIWLIARALGKGRAGLPRRLIYVVDRRAVVDQATRMVDAMGAALLEPACKPLRDELGLEARSNASSDLVISTLRGQHADNRKWLRDPSAPAIIVGTVDIIGSRLLFEGYGVARGMRPFHAGLLGADSLVVLDESHLVPPFQKLIEQIADGAKDYGPRRDSAPWTIPPMRLLSLSATIGKAEGTVFSLQESDHDDITQQRLDAVKGLTLETCTDDKNANEVLAARAWVLSNGPEGPCRVLIFCNRRDADDKDPLGASAQGVLEALEKRAKGDKKSDIPATDIDTELLVGARRVKERADAQQSLETLGFLSTDNRTRPDRPTFLIATSAGEVGVDLDADHLVCDLVTWERMVQRFGRVNRRGERDDSQIVVYRLPPPKKHDEDLQARHDAAWALLEGLKGDASPGAVSPLARDCADAIAGASSKPPLRPPLSRALVDAWSMTSLEEHTGRPEIAPWLRGWVDDLPQTTLVWRRHLPPRALQERYFAAAPPLQSEKLETETFRVGKWLKSRATAMAIANGDAGENAFSQDDMVAFALNRAGEPVKYYDFPGFDSAMKDQRLERDLAGKTLVVDARLGGLSTGGLLDTKSGSASAADDQDWPDEEAGLRIGETTSPAENHPEKGWKLVDWLEIKHNEEGEATRWMVISAREAVSDIDEDFRSRAQKAQLLSDHGGWTKDAAERIAAALDLPDALKTPLVLAARLHDEGKAAAIWQRAFSAPGDGVYAKTRGPVFPRKLAGYRHEFGSLPVAEKDPEFQQLTDDQKDLVLHLIAAHHGFARPLIAPMGEDAPPSLLQARAGEVALRFARLQKRYGPWGLAWLEALVRAADWEASERLDNENEREGVAHG